MSLNSIFPSALSFENKYPTNVRVESKFIALLHTAAAASQDKYTIDELEVGVCSVSASVPLALTTTTFHAN